MPETNALKSTIEKILKSIPSLVTESGELKINKIKQDVENASPFSSARVSPWGSSPSRNTAKVQTMSWEKSWAASGQTYRTESPEVPWNRW